MTASRNGAHRSAWRNSVVGPKRTALEPGELIAEIRLPARLGSQQFLKVGTRNAMVIAVANVALVADWQAEAVRCALGSVGPKVIRAVEAEEFISSRIDWDDRALLDPGDMEQFVGLGARFGKAYRRPPLHGRLPPPRRRNLRRNGRSGVCSPPAAHRVKRGRHG